VSTDPATSSGSGLTLIGCWDLVSDCSVAVQRVVDVCSLDVTFVVIVELVSLIGCWDVVSSDCSVSVDVPKGVEIGCWDLVSDCSVVVQRVVDVCSLDAKFVVIVELVSLIGCWDVVSSDSSIVVPRGVEVCSLDATLVVIVELVIDVTDKLSGSVVVVTRVVLEFRNASLVVAVICVTLECNDEAVICVTLECNDASVVNLLSPLASAILSVSVSTSSLASTILSVSNAEIYITVFQS